MTTELEKRNRELTILNKIAEALNRTADLDEMVREALGQVVGLLGLETGWVWLLREDTGDSYLAAAQNLPPGLAGAPARMEGGCYCLNSYREGDLEGAANVNVIECSRLHGLVSGTQGLRYHASIPLYAQEEKLGVLNVASTDWRELSRDELRLLYTVGDMLGSSIERARLYARSVRLGTVEERNRLAREIHDTLAQGLAAAALQLESADAALEGGPAAQAQGAVRKALELTRANLEEARRSVLDLRAAPLEGRDLAGALGELAVEAGERWGLPVRVSVVGGGRPLPARLEAGLYRMAQEALTNVARHAGAATVALALTMTPERITLMVEDDGQGFAPEAVTGQRFGLIGLRERAHLLGGDLRLESAVDQGTRLTVTLPLAEGGSA